MRATLTQTLTRANGITCACSLVIGALIGITLVLYWPGAYFRISQSISWRLNWPFPAQVLLEQTMVSLQLRGDALVQVNDTLMFGDSHLQAIPSATLDRAVNYAIGGETAKHLAARVQRYPSLDRAKAVVLMSGSNDLATHAPPPHIERSIVQVMGAIPSTTLVSLMSIPPRKQNDNDAKLRLETNRLLRRACNNRPRCHFVDLEFLTDPTGQLSSSFDSGDGIHLNDKGNAYMVSQIQISLKPQ